MQCPGCQHENRPQAKFCEECATPLARTCANCGTQATVSAKFCSECAHPLGGPPVAEPRLRSPQAYTPKHLAEKILTSRSALEGERKQVTVLFADLKGSMELLADRDPEEARRLLDPVLERMMEAVHRYEGTVNQVMGDGIMALFGAPLAHEDHAVRACYAALRMQESVKRYAEEVHRTAGVPLHIRVGLNSGEVVVRSIGSDLHMDYTAVGQTTHLAARLEQMAMPGAILISPETLNLAEGYVQVKPLGPVPLKGLAEPVEVYELVGTGVARTRLQAAARRGLSRFVGRDAELEQLRGALEKAGRGHGQVVAVVGEPGVGKSRLFYELTHSHRVQGWLVIESGSVSYGSATAYLPVIDLLKAYFKIQDRDEKREIREKVTGKLLTLDEALRPLLPTFCALLDVPVEDREWQALDPPQRRRHTLEAIRRLLLRESQLQPLCLVFEDLHWIDGETQAFLDGLVESLPAARILLLVNYRPEYGHAWGSKTYYGQARIDPLPAESATELLDALLGDDASLGPLKPLLVERTEGNPFFVEESVRTLIESRVLAGDLGRYRLTQPLASIQVPATVQAILAARIDRLPPEEKRLLQSAAVVGKDVPFPLLQAIADVPEESLRRGLTHLQAAEFLYETNLFPDLEYTFKHALTHEVAYGSLLQDRRRALHARVVEAIEQLHADRLAEQVERLAHHALRGEMWGEAVAYLRQAGAKAAAQSAHLEAVTHFRQALSVQGHLPETRQTLENAIDLRFALRSSLIPLGEVEQILEHLLEAETLAQGLGDQVRLGWVSTYMTLHLSMSAQIERSLASGRRAAAIAAAVGDLALQTVANAYLGQALYRAGEYRLAVERCRASVQLLSGDLNRERFGQAALPSVYSRAYLACSLAELGEFSEGAASAEDAIRIAEAQDQPFSLGMACNGAGRVYLRKGDLDRAILALTRGLEICRSRSIRIWLPVVRSSLSLAYALSGRCPEALSLLEDSLDPKVPTQTSLDHSLSLTWLSETYLMAGRIEDAIHHAEEALDLACNRQERGVQAQALRLLGDVGAKSDYRDDLNPEARYAQALALAAELGMRPLAAHCHLGLGKLYRRTGDSVQVQEHLTTAATMYREMDMGFWPAQAEAALREGATSPQSG